MRRERIWASNYTLNEMIGGAEIMGEQYAKALNLAQYSSHKLGGTEQDVWELALHMDDFLKRFENIELLVRNSVVGSTFGAESVKADLDVAVCCENFLEEAKSLKGEPMYGRKLYDYDRQKKSLAVADRIVVPSIYEQRTFREDGIDSVVIEPYVDSGTFYPMPRKEARNLINVDDDEKVVLFVGRRHVRKGYDAAVKAAKKNPDTTFVFVLSGDSLDAKRDNMVFMSNVSRENMNVLYNSADAFFFPSKYEGFGIVLAEALMTGVPVVTYATGLASKEDRPNIANMTVCEPEYDGDALVESLNGVLARGGDSDRRVPEELVERFSEERFNKQCVELVS